MKTILVPIDLNENATTPALAEAVRLAANYDAKLTLLSVVPALPSYLKAQLPEDFLERSRVQETYALDRIVEEYGLPAGTSVTVREGHAARQILEYARDCNADLIIMASHDPGPATHVLGSVAAYVVRHAHCSVYVVRQPRH
jgi:nucleotide-binding universal stress UspA family protein